MTVPYNPNGDIQQQVRNKQIITCLAMEEDKETPAALNSTKESGIMELEDEDDCNELLQVVISMEENSGSFSDTISRTSDYESSQDDAVMLSSGAEIESEKMKEREMMEIKKKSNRDNFMEECLPDVEKELNASCCTKFIRSVFDNDETKTFKSGNIIALSGYMNSGKTNLLIDYCMSCTHEKILYLVDRDLFLEDIIRRMEAARQSHKTVRVTRLDDGLQYLETSTERSCYRRTIFVASVDSLYILTGNGGMPKADTDQRFDLVIMDNYNGIMSTLLYLKKKWMHRSLDSALEPVFSTKRIICCEALYFDFTRRSISNLRGSTWSVLEVRLVSNLSSKQIFKKVLLRDVKGQRLDMYNSLTGRKQIAYCHPVLEQMDLMIDTLETSKLTIDDEESCFIVLSPDTEAYLKNSHYLSVYDRSTELTNASELAKECHVFAYSHTIACGHSIHANGMMDAVYGTIILHGSFSQLSDQLQMLGRCRDTVDQELILSVQRGDVCRTKHINPTESEIDFIREYEMGSEKLMWNIQLRKITTMKHISTLLAKIFPGVEVEGNLHEPDILPSKLQIPIIEPHKGSTEEMKIRRNIRSQRGAKYTFCQSTLITTHGNADLLQHSDAIDFISKPKQPACNSLSVNPRIIHFSSQQWEDYVSKKEESDICKELHPVPCAPLRGYKEGEERYTFKARDVFVIPPADTKINHYREKTKMAGSRFMPYMRKKNDVVQRLDFQ